MGLFLLTLPREKNLPFATRILLVYHSLHCGTEFDNSVSMNIPQQLQIRGNYALIYNDYSYLNRSHNRKLINNLGNTKTYSGKVSQSAKKRIVKTISCLVQKSSDQYITNPTTGKKMLFKIGFLTLTIPDKTGTNASYYYQKALKPFLRILSERYDCKDYIWKAELQKRGSIHYHITLNRFVHWQSLRGEWNKILDKADLMQSYKEDYKNTNPNSVDIHSVKNVKNLESYLAKYISKVEKDKVSLQGKVWGCSSTLQGIKYHSTVVTEYIYRTINALTQATRITMENFEQYAILRFKGLTDWNLFGTCFVSEYNNWRWCQT